jgi:hypothetical protein
MVKKQVKFDPENIERLGKQGTSKDTLDMAFAKVLDIVEDVRRCMEGEEPHTEELQKLKRKWCK